MKKKKSIDQALISIFIDKLLKVRKNIMTEYPEIFISAVSYNQGDFEILGTIKEQPFILQIDSSKKYLDMTIGQLTGLVLTYILNIPEED